MTPTEWIEDYRPGVYHPVHFGDVLNDRYQFLQKLGYGSFSTVRLAKDQKSGANSYVAVKILTSNSSITQSESNIHKILSESQLKHSGKENFMTVLDSFDHPGPNGTYRCLVFDVMGPSAAHLVEEIPDKFIETDDSRRYPTPTTNWGVARIYACPPIFTMEG